MGVIYGRQEEGMEQEREFSARVWVCVWVCVGRGMNRTDERDEGNAMEWQKCRPGKIGTIEEDASTKCN